MYYNNYLQTCSFKLNFELGDHIFESLLQILTKIFCQTLNLKIHKKVKNIPNTNAQSNEVNEYFA